MYYRYQNEVREVDKPTAETLERQKKQELIDALADSKSFVRTHMLIKSLAAYEDFDRIMCEALYRIATENPQVKLILKDKDVSEFYGRLLAQTEVKTDAAQETADILRSEK